MIVLIRCNDIVSDSRAKKYIDFYEKKNLDYRIIAWDRVQSNHHLPNAIVYKGRSKYNQGGIKAVQDRIKWMYFVLCTLFRFRRNLTIHACDLDAAFPAVIYKLISSKTNKVFFDVFDWFTDTLYNQGWLVLLAFKYMERIAVKGSNHIIICEEERINQIPYDVKGRYSVLPNIPSFSSSNFLKQDESLKFANKKKTLSYVGGFVPDRCLEMLIKGAVEARYNLLIAGYGMQSYERELAEIKDSANIKYLGKVPYQDGLNIMYNSDMIYAMYSMANPNHYYAAPNKYYEAMFLGKPIISTVGILLSDKITQNGMGFLVEESYESLCSLIDRVDMADVKVCAENSARLWDIYKDYTSNYLENNYLNLL
jgi:glycosyltransferase involved in cell wall biosynthesis